jgi:hypothetical protein
MNIPLSRDFARFDDGNAEGIHPGRLWSLWDMLKVNGTSFYKTTALMKRLEVIFDQLRAHVSQEGWKLKIANESDKATFTEPVMELRGQLEILEARFTIMSVDDFCSHVNTGE